MPLILNRLLHDTEYAAIAVPHLGSQIEIEATAVGRTAAAGREFEESLRASSLSPPRPMRAGRILWRSSTPS